MIVTETSPTYYDPRSTATSPFNNYGYYETIIVTEDSTSADIEIDVSKIKRRNKTKRKTTVLVLAIDAGEKHLRPVIFRRRKLKRKRLRSWTGMNYKPTTGK